MPDNNALRPSDHICRSPRRANAVMTVVLLAYWASQINAMQDRFVGFLNATVMVVCPHPTAETAALSTQAVARQPH